MANFRQGCGLALSLALWGAAAMAADPAPAATPELYDRPVLVVDPDMHTAPIRRASADAEDHWVVTGSHDKTARVWALADGSLLRTIRLPAGPGNVGKVYAVAMSPDGSLVAAGGWMRWTEVDRRDQIYLFDRSTGSLVERIDGLPDVVLHLAFSPDGRRLAATIANSGLRLYDRDRGWAEIARDGAYRDQNYGASFAPDGRLATTGDGKVRLYSRELTGNIGPRVAFTSASSGSQPFSIAFSPDGTRLAVGYNNSTVVTLLDGSTLAELPGPNTRSIGGGNLMTVAWSRDGRTLFASGRRSAYESRHVFAWSDDLAGRPRTLAAGRDTVMSLIPLFGGDVLVASQDPMLARLREDGSAAWMHEPPTAYFRNSDDDLAVSSDGTLVGFSFQDLGKARAQFNLATRTLAPGPPSPGQTAGPRVYGLAIKGWKNTEQPTRDGHPLRLDRHEISRSLAIHPAGDRFVIGAEWTLRAFDSDGVPLWTRRSPSIAWAVNITGDGRLVVGAYGDGTIRWHRMSDGVELLAFMPLSNLADWVAWTPEGFYAATPGAHGILRWHVNRGWDAPADSIPIADIPGSFRPAVLPLVLQEMETPRALGLAVLAEHNKEVAIRTHSQLPPGVQLHLLTIGISTYNEDYARNLRLNYADRDARDLASAIVTTQEGLYSKVTAQALTDKDANRGGILRGLQTLRTAMERKGGDDLAVVHFSGHGAVVDGRLYLLPQETDARDAIGIKNTALSIDDLRAELLELAKHGRVLVLLDACHSGAATMDGTPLVMDSTALRTGLAAANVTEKSREDAEWGHGAFTKTLLDALNDPTADTNRTGLINATGLANYIAGHVASLTHGKQTPDMEVRFGSTVFAVGM